VPTARRAEEASAPTLGAGSGGSAAQEGVPGTRRATAADVPPPPLPEDLDPEVRRRLADALEVRPWLRDLSPRDDHRLASGSPPADRPSPPPKPVARISVDLAITTNPVEGVKVRVNGRVVEGEALQSVPLELTGHGDLEVVASKPGHATVTRRIRLGRGSAGGRIPIHLDLPVDAPKEDDSGAGRESGKQSR
jgi:hypothetical protein